MKKIKILGLLIIAVSLMMGCKKKFLEDIKSFDKYDESIFENEVLTGWYVDRVYYDYFQLTNRPYNQLLVHILIQDQGLLKKLAVPSLIISTLRRLY